VLIDAPYPAENNDGDVGNVLAEVPDRNIPDPSVPVMQTRKKNNASGPHEQMINFEGLYTLPQSQLNSHSTTPAPGGNNSIPGDWSLQSVLPPALPPNMCAVDMDLVNEGTISDGDIDPSLLPPNQCPTETQRGDVQPPDMMQEFPMLQPEIRLPALLQGLDLAGMSQNRLPSIYTSPNNPPASAAAEDNTHSVNGQAAQATNTKGSRKQPKETKKRKSDEAQLMETAFPAETRKRYGPDD